MGLPRRQITEKWTEHAHRKCHLCVADSREGTRGMRGQRVGSQTEDALGRLPAECAVSGVLKSPGANTGLRKEGFRCGTKTFRFCSNFQL